MKVDVNIYKRLLKAQNGDKDDLDFIQERMLKPLKYVNSVVEEAIILPAIKEKYWDDPSILQYNVMKLDAARRNAHENCISAMDQLNRLCKINDLPPIYPGDINDRYAVADFAIEVVRTFYAENQSRTKNLSNEEFVMNQKEKIKEKDVVTPYLEEER